MQLQRLPRVVSISVSSPGYPYLPYLPGESQGGDAQSSSPIESSRVKSEVTVICDVPTSNGSNLEAQIVRKLIIVHVPGFSAEVPKGGGGRVHKLPVWLFWI